MLPSGRQQGSRSLWEDSPNMGLGPLGTQRCPATRRGRGRQTWPWPEAAGHWQLRLSPFIVGEENSRKLIQCDLFPEVC